MDASLGEHQYTAQTGTSSNLSQVLLEQNAPTPLMDQWNLNIQYEFAPTWVLELGYIGSHGIHQTSAIRELNEAELASPSNPVNGITTNTVANANVRVPYLGFSPAGLSDDEFTGDAKFNSLQATVRKQLSHGLTLQAAYTWSKSLTDFNVASQNQDSNDPNNLAQQYGPNPALPSAAARPELQLGPAHWQSGRIDGQTAQWVESVRCDGRSRRHTFNYHRYSRRIQSTDSVLDLL